MKKAVMLMTLFAGICATNFSYAEEQDMPQSRPPRDRQGMMGGQGMMKGGMPQQPTMIATTDGGVVIFMGGKLAKYDAAMNLVKEVELKGGPKPPSRSEDVMPPKDELMDSPMSDMPPPVPMDEAAAPGPAAAEAPPTQ